MTGTSGLAAAAGIELSSLETLSARTLEVVTAGDLQMAAIVTNEPPVWERCHLSEFVVRDAVRAPHYRHGHCQHSPDNPLLAGRLWPDSNRELLQKCKHCADARTSLFLVDRARQLL
jgi:hypothetical protein